jgi:glutamate dehydrogenase/leucine dehydrogenase
MPKRVWIRQDEEIIMEAIFSYMEKYDYENLFLCQDKALAFKAIIAIHDTTLGPATGGCRMWEYDGEMEAIEDALRLARGMVYAPDYITNAGGTIYDTDRLGVGGVSHERGKEKVSRIYDNMNRVFEIADRDKIPTYLAADRMAEERIKQIAEVKKYRDDLRP